MRRKVNISTLMVFRNQRRGEEEEEEEEEERINNFHK
jgi:hypothetical protein